VTEYVEVPIGDLLEARSGRPKYIRDYVDAHPGEFPVYSASLQRPFGFVDSYDYDGAHLTWVMNGYGGRVQEVRGRFSATRDRGVFVARADVEVPDLTYLRFALEPQLVAAAVGRRVDGRLNEYTKIYPGTAEAVVVSLPVTESGGYDHPRMRVIGERLRRVEKAQHAVRAAHEPLSRATFTVDVEAPFTVLPLGDSSYFKLSIGERVLRKDHLEGGVPVYSANALVPFGRVGTSNLTNFEKPSLLWGIDGVYDWNLLPAGEPFATTDHCGRLQLESDRLDLEYVYHYLRSTRERYGFDRVFRASLKNMRADVQVTVPIGGDGLPCLERQRVLAEEFRRRESARVSSMAALTDVLRARLAVEL
jgi:hypothetical protein